MTKRTSNQYRSRKAELLLDLRIVRNCLNEGLPVLARLYLTWWRRQYALVPASTRRRWKCGR